MTAHTWCPLPGPVAGEVGGGLDGRLHGLDVRLPLPGSAPRQAAGSACRRSLSTQPVERRGAARRRAARPVCRRPDPVARTAWASALDEPTSTTSCLARVTAV